MLRLSVKLFTIINPIQIIPKNVETKKIETYLTLTGLIWRALSISFISWQYSLILLAADEYFFLYLQKAKKKI